MSVCPGCGDAWSGVDRFCSCNYCRNCNKPEAAHLDGKCLFEASEYVSSNEAPSSEYEIDYKPDPQFDSPSPWDS